MSELTKYRVGIVNFFHAEDDAHAVEQFNNYLGVETGAINILETEPPSLEDALNARINATETFSEVACNEIEAKATAKYPTAAYAKVTAILMEGYTEHHIEVYDAQNNRLDEDFDWEDAVDEDWFLTVTEGACGFEDYVTVAFGAEMTRAPRNG